MYSAAYTLLSGVGIDQNAVLTGWPGRTGPGISAHWCGIRLGQTHDEIRMVRAGTVVVPADLLSLPLYCTRNCTHIFFPSTVPKEEPAGTGPPTPDTPQPETDN